MKRLLDIRLPIGVVLGLVLLVVTLNLIPEQHAVRQPIPHTHGISDPQFLETMEAVYRGQVRRGHGVETLVNGDEIFPAMLGAIREARSSVNFETYIYWSGEIALRFAKTLADKARQTRACISAWRLLPDYASVNLSERDAPAVIALLHRMGVGVEAGLATVADAKRFVTLPDCHRALRILIEIEEQNPEKADEIAGGIAQVLERAHIRRPILLHGFDATVWHFAKRAHQRRWSTRVGLEDGCQLTNGGTAVGEGRLGIRCVSYLSRGTTLTASHPDDTFVPQSGG